MGYAQKSVLGRMQKGRNRAKPASDKRGDRRSRGKETAGAKDPGRLDSRQGAPVVERWVDGAHRRTGGGRRSGENSNVIYVTTSHVEFSCDLDTFQAFSLVDREAFRRLLKFQRPSTNDRDIPHRTSVANAVHAKAHKVRDILKSLFTVRIITIVRVYFTYPLEYPRGGFCDSGWLVVISPRPIPWGYRALGAQHTQFPKRLVSSHVAARIPRG